MSNPDGVPAECRTAPSMKSPTRRWCCELGRGGVLGSPIPCTRIEIELSKETQHRVFSSYVPGLVIAMTGSPAGALSHVSEAVHLLG
jgi:hypothetical protein